MSTLCLRIYLFKNYKKQATNTKASAAAPKEVWQWRHDDVFSRCFPVSPLSIWLSLIGTDTIFCSIFFLI